MDIDQEIREHGNAVLADVWGTISDRLLRMIEFRLDRRLSGRVAPEDILQDAWMEVDRRLQTYIDSPDVSFFVWARKITWQCVIAVQRRHFGEKRSPKKEVRYGRGEQSASFSIARHLIGQNTSPSRRAIREEQVHRLREALDDIDEIDREVLAMRHFEQLSNTEVAQTLGLSTTAASNRYVRALARLGEILSSMDEFKDE